MIVQKHVKRTPICFARDQVCVISIVRHFCCGSGVCWIDCSRVSYVRLINQCGLYVDKIKILKKISGCGLYTGALNWPKITVLFANKRSKKADGRGITQSTKSLKILQGVGGQERDGRGRGVEGALKSPSSEKFWKANLHYINHLASLT